VSRSDLGTSRVAVTGASGFVGRHLIESLVRDGRSVAALSRQSKTIAGVTAWPIPDYGDIGTLAKAFDGVDTVFHLAARAHQHDTGDAALQYREANVDVTRNIVRACLESGVRRLVFASSIGVHGNLTDRHPFTERDRPAPVDAYAVSKLAAEQAVTEGLRSGPTDHVILRPPLVYGAGCPGNFRSLLRLAARAPIVPLGALRAPRSFIYIDNLVDALLLAARHPGTSRRVFVVADKRDTSVAEIVRTVTAELGRSSHAVLNVAPGLLALIARMAGKSTAYAKLAAPLQVDAAEFSRVTGWTPPVDTLEGLRRTARQWATASVAA
jgi:UDP-4-keto-D-FucNAc 4-reductase